MFDREKSPNQRLLSTNLTAGCPAAQPSDEDVAIPCLTVVISQHDVPDSILAERFVFVELAVRHVLVPAGPGKRLVNDQLAVDPMLNSLILHANFANVEFPRPDSGA